MQIFSRSFLIDFITTLVPLVLVCTVFSKWKVQSQAVLMGCTLVLYNRMTAINQKLTFPIVHFLGTSYSVRKNEVFNASTIEETILKYINDLFYMLVI